MTWLARSVLLIAPADGRDVAPQVFASDQTGRVVLTGVDTQTSREPCQALREAAVRFGQVVAADQRTDVGVDA